MIRLPWYWVLSGARGFSAVCMGIGLCAGFGFEAMFVARFRDSTCWSFSGCVGYLAPSVRMPLQEDCKLPGL